VWRKEEKMRGAPRGDVVVMVGSLVRMRVVLNLPHAPVCVRRIGGEKSLLNLNLKGIRLASFTRDIGVSAVGDYDQQGQG
jgi:hypothetical protein